MEQKTSTLKAMIKKHGPKKETLDPRRWMRQETVKGFTDFLLDRNSDKDTDDSFDNKEMLLDAEKQFMDAAKRNDVVAMKSLCKGLNANAKNVHNRTALHFAVAGRHKEAVQFLLQRRVKVDQMDKYGVTPIHLAAWFGSLEILKLLVQAGAEQKVENEVDTHNYLSPQTLLLTEFSLWKRQPLDKEHDDTFGQVAVALKEGPDITSHDRIQSHFNFSLPQEGLNIMHCAAINNHTDIVEYIVNDLQMKELDKEDQSGHQAFALAAENGCVQMLEMLMEPYQMASMKPNKRGDTPLHLAARNGHLDSVQLLLQSFDTLDEVNVDGETALYQAVNNGQEECVHTLLETGCDPNILTTAKCSALHPVAERGDAALVQLLLEYKANPDFQNEHLEAPLHLAVKNSHIPVIHSLLKAGCNVNITDKRAQTAMHFAAELARIEVVEILLKAGPDLTLQDRQGKTALGVAARANEAIIVDMIIRAERYYAWRTANPELNETVHNEHPLTFKLHHRYETRQFRSMAWQLAYQLLKPGDWKRLAGHWNFTKEQVSAIEEQWTDQHSYKEHGNRMLLIWLHGEEMSQKNPAKELFQGLTATGNRKAADKLRTEADSTNNNTKSCNIS